MKRKWTISPAIAGHYKIVNTESPILHSKVGDIDFRKISLEDADRLFSKGTRYLEKLKRIKKAI